jgi:hypothetical protein
MGTARRTVLRCDPGNPAHHHPAAAINRAGDAAGRYPLAR